MSARLLVVAVFALATITVSAAVTGDLRMAAFAAGALAATALGTVPALVALVACALGGAWLVVGCLVLVAVINLLPHLRLALPWLRADGAALLAGLQALPPALAAELRDTAGGRPLTTRELVAVALHADPQRWRSLLGADPGTGAWDGPLLTPAPPGGPCTQYAAEAAVLAHMLSEDLAHPIDCDLLAVAATLVALSAASEWSGRLDAIADRGVGAGVAQLSAAASAFIMTPAGSDMDRRVEIVVRSGVSPKLGEDRRQVAGLSRRRLLAHQLLPALVSARPTLRPPPKPKPQPAPQPQPAPRTEPKPQPAPPPKPKPTPQQPTFQQRRRAAARARLRAWRAVWGAWPLPARIAWLGLRPLLGLAAIAVPAIVGEVGWLGACVVALTVLLVRPLRHRWLAAVAAAALVPLSPLAAALFAARVLVVELVLRWRGLAPVVETRRALMRLVELEPVPLAQAESSLRERLTAAIAERDEDELVKLAVDYVAAAWAEADLPRFVRALIVLARGTLSGQWEGREGHTNMMRELMRMAVMEWTLLALVRVPLVVATIALGAVAIGPVGPFDAKLLGYLAAAAAVGACVVPISAKPRSVLGIAIGIGIAWALTGSAVWQPLAIGAVAGFAISGVRRRVSRTLAVGRERWRVWPVPHGPRRLRSHWRVAERALAEGRDALAAQMFRDLAADPRAKQDLAAAALGRVALIELDRGRLDAASTAVDAVVRATDEGSKGSAATSARAAAGLASAALGDLGTAERLLRQLVEMLPRDDGLRPRLVMTLADVCARRGDPDGAVVLLAQLRAHPLSVQGLDSLVETEVAIAAALARQGKYDAARERLDDLHGFGDDQTNELGREMVTRIARAEARAALLSGQIELERRRPQAAEPLLRRAVGHLAAASDGQLRATAQVLHGAAMTLSGRHEPGVATVRDGIAELERRRTQLHVSDRRTAMVVADSDVYEWALRALAVGGRAGVEAAGDVAAMLVESLRRSAISTTLRAGPLPLPPSARALADRIAVLERVVSPPVEGQETAASQDKQRAAELAELRVGLTREVSAQFAAAYLPTPATLAQLRGIAIRWGHVLAYYVPARGFPAWCVWIPPSGTIRVEEVVLRDGPASEVVAALGSGVLSAVAGIHEPLSDGDGAVWSELAEALLPAALREQLASAGERSDRLLVVPDGPLSLLPWPALQIAGEPLVAHAAVQVVPALELLATASAAPDRNGHVVAHLDERLAGSGHEAQLLEDGLDVTYVGTRDAFATALDTGRFGGAYIATHGIGMGIDQQVIFADGAALSAASALRHPWPRWTVFASCLIGRVEHVIGREPFGLAISCMLGGCHTVVGSVVEITSAVAPTVCGPLSVALADGVHPADALRTAQRAYLESCDVASIADCLGLICISTLAPAHR